MTNPTHEVEHLAVMHVELSITRQPEPYHSIRAAVSLPVFVSPDDNAAQIFQQKLADIRRELQEEINAEFESHDEPAPYGDEPRYSLIRAPQDKGLYAIVPHEESKTLPDGWSLTMYDGRHRYKNLRRMIQIEYGQRITDLIDCTQGDEVPELDQMYLVTSHDHRFQFITREGSDQIPLDLKGKYGYLSFHQFQARPDKIMDVIEEHRRQSYQFMNCLDADYSRLPIRLRRDILANPVLNDGELGLITDQRNEPETKEDEDEVEFDEWYEDEDEDLDEDDLPF